MCREQLRLTRASRDPLCHRVNPRANRRTRAFVCNPKLIVMVDSPLSRASEPPIAPALSLTSESSR
jgi:hypothetical protein